MIDKERPCCFISEVKGLFHKSPSYEVLIFEEFQVHVE